MYILLHYWLKTFNNDVFLHKRNKYKYIVSVGLSYLITYKADWGIKLGVVTSNFYRLIFEIVDSWNIHCCFKCVSLYFKRTVNNILQTSVYHSLILLSSLETNI